MSCASRTERGARRGLTLVEVMIVVAIVLLFNAAAVTVFIQLIQTSDAVDARIEAVKNARFFLDTLSEDLAQASLSAAIAREDLFRCTHTPLTHGDLVDNDGDGVVDEESPDGLDNDGDWVLANDDRDFRTLVSTAGGVFPPIVSLAERGWLEPDLGDGHVDEDVVFNADELSFWLRGPLTGNVQRQRVTYRIEPFEGEANVAVRRVRTVFNDGSPDLEEVGPLAFGVVGVNFLCWDHRAAPQRWAESWTSEFIPPTEIGAPVAVYAEITVHSDSTRLSLPPARPLSTVRIATLVVLENVLRSPDFPRGDGRSEGEPPPLVIPRGAAGDTVILHHGAPATPAPGEPSGPAGAPS